MKALVVHAYGEPETYAVEEVPVPHAGPGQIQVRIEAASLNAVDLRLARGGFRTLVDLPFPHVPGNDFAGTITETGAGVTAYTIGDLVFGHGVARAMAGFLALPKPSLTTGAIAEYAVFEADTPFIARRPKNLDTGVAAALPTAGLTTRALLARAKIRPGERVLLIGATGGVGTTLLPELEADVIATGRPGDETILRELGASEVIGYDDYPTDVDVVINAVLPGDHLTEAAKSLKPGGRLYTITFPAPVTGRNDIHPEMVLDTSVEMRATIGLRPTIGRRYSLDEAARAMVDFARAHTVGKLVVAV